MAVLLGIPLISIPADATSFIDGKVEEYIQEWDKGDKKGMSKLNDVSEQFGYKELMLDTKGKIIKEVEIDAEGNEVEGSEKVVDEKTDPEPEPENTPSEPTELQDNQPVEIE